MKAQTHIVPEDESAAAFEELRREVSFTRCAVEGLTAARERTPDYTVTLGHIDATLKIMVAAVDRIERSPAVKLTPDATAAEMIKASATARAEDARLLNEARSALSHSIGQVDGVVRRGQAADGQIREKLWIAIGSGLIGMLLWSALPGAIARSLPESWHVPEWMAARALRMDQREAGERLVRSSAHTRSASPAD